MENNELNNEMETEGMTKEELLKFFDHLALFCSQCKAIPLGRTVESCKRPSCLLYMMRNIPELLKTRKNLIDRFLLQRRGLTPQPVDPRIRSSYPTLNARG